MYFECVRNHTGVWDLGNSISDQAVMQIQSRVRIETENKPYPSASSSGGAFPAGTPTGAQRDAYLKDLTNRQVRGERLSEEDAWTFYTLQVNTVPCSHVKCRLV